MYSIDNNNCYNIIYSVHGVQEALGQSHYLPVQKNYYNEHKFMMQKNKKS